MLETTLQIEHRIENGVLIIVIKGTGIDAREAPSIRKEIISLVSEYEVRNLVLDLKFVNFIDSSGLGLFLSIANYMNGLKGGVKLSQPNKTVKNLLELVSLHKVFDIYNLTDDAVRSFKTNA